MVMKYVKSLVLAAAFASFVMAPKAGFAGSVGGTTNLSVIGTFKGVKSVSIYDINGMNAKLLSALGGNGYVQSISSSGVASSGRLALSVSVQDQWGIAGSSIPSLADPTKSNLSISARSENLSFSPYGAGYIFSGYVDVTGRQDIVSDSGKKTTRNIYQKAYFVYNTGENFGAIIEFYLPEDNVTGRPSLRYSIALNTTLTIR